MKILFVHQNFPGQFTHLARALASDSANEVLAISARKNSPPVWQGVKIVQYNIPPVKLRHDSWLAEFEAKTIRAEICFAEANKLKEEGFNPDIIIAHPSWGESLYLKEVWPEARLGIYCEFFYRASGADMGFDQAQTPVDPKVMHRFSLKNMNHLMHLDIADSGISPTQWQAGTFPKWFQEKITIIHDGIDTENIKPSSDAFVTLNGAQRFTKDDEVITFVNRNLEPYRGYHIFMEAIPQILKERPNAHIFLVGGTEVSYGPPAPKGQSWAEIFASKAKAKVSAEDWGRVHFLGKLPYADYLAVLQISSAHVYLTYPFVLSWSLLEAMSIECPIVASNTAPVAEFIQNDETGLLVDFFSADEITLAVNRILSDKKLAQKLGKNARQFIQNQYDLQQNTLPKQLLWVDALFKAKTALNKGFLT
jgi:glycosyltransferase involved in cell wall biosynthesis